jgi:hypothetical protein
MGNLSEPFPNVNCELARPPISPAAVAELDALWWRKNHDLLKGAIETIAKGHYNNSIRRLLASIAGIAGWPALRRMIETLPDRHVCGVREAWVEAALKLYCQEEARRCQDKLRHMELLTASRGAEGGTVQ